MGRRFSNELSCEPPRWDIVVHTLVRRGVSVLWEHDNYQPLLRVNDLEALGFCDEAALCHMDGVFLCNYKDVYI